jgi:hypothetical protein
MAESDNTRQQPLPYEDAPFLHRKDEGDTNLQQMLTRHETLLSYLQTQRETDASRQLELLQAIKDELASQATPLHFISNAIIQLIFITSAFIFGIFTIYGVVYQIEANLLSVIQNQINIITFCQTNNSVRDLFLTGKTYILIILLDHVRQTLQ